MERGLILLAVTLMVYLAPGVHGTSHLTFDNTTQVNISRDGCGTTKLCVETPDDCHPTVNASSSCLFASLDVVNMTAPNGSDLAVELRANATGYVALGLAANESEGVTMVFVCGQNNSMFFFRTGQTNNSANSSSFMANERRVKDIRGLVNGTVIRCEFTVPSLNASSRRLRSADTTYSVFLGTGDSATIGNINFTVKAGRLNLNDPASNIPTTVAPTTQSASGAAFQPHAVLLLLGVLICTVMLRV